jgi:uncharacterized protein YhfF
VSEAVEAYWNLARVRARLNAAPGYFGPGPLESVPPPAWSFGATPEQADELTDLVLDGTKTATASALWDYEAEGEPLPAPGTLGIVVDGRGAPRALVETTAVTVLPFDEVDEEHAYLEGEGDRSLARWREVHERFFTEHASHGHGFRPDMPIVLERFRVVDRAS